MVHGPQGTDCAFFNQETISAFQMPFLHLIPIHILSESPDHFNQKCNNIK
uniref:Uncharacterized protein n=1 Tax=Anguilla anguilla TaxID=7936 RepID=A0A0E9W9X4_ANGAN